eukprot:TCALIF_02748-PA protein Name:"Protein of unknown function" AED:0.51 eAED:0.51 QI:0/0.5/0.33/0.66/0/0/3/175/70
MYVVFAASGRQKFSPLALTSLHNKLCGLGMAARYGNPADFGLFRQSATVEGVIFLKSPFFYPHSRTSSVD